MTNTTNSTPVTAAKSILATAAYMITDMGWCQGDFSYDKNGEYCFYDSPRAVRWCMVGAIERAGYELNCEDFTGIAVERAHQHTPGMAGLAEFNDLPTSTAERVAAVLQQAADA